MAIAHGHHDASKGERLLYDGCQRCDQLSKSPHDLDTLTLRQAAELVRGKGLHTRRLSMNEQRIVTHLRLMRATVERAGLASKTA